MNRGYVWIIPDENQILAELFKESVETEEGHARAIQDFCDKFNLGIKLSQDDSVTAPFTITSLGHMVIKSEDEQGILVVYLPEIVTDRQIEFLYKNKDELMKKYMQINAYTKNEDNYNKVHGMIDILKEASRKNINKEKSDINVR